MIVLALLALAVYRPWVPRPFDIRDFSEFLPILRGEGGVGGHFVALARYYAHDHGRLNLVSYLGLAAKWSLFGDATWLWQWARVGEMALVMMAVTLFLRRLAFGLVAALAGASLFLVSRTASEGWTRLTMGEPFGLLLALGALLCAVRWNESRRSVAAAAGAGLLMLLAVLAKEMLLGLLPLVWLVGCCRRADGTLGPPTLDAATRRFLLWSGVPAIAVFGVAALVALGGRSDGFTALYGESPGGVTQLVNHFGRPWLIQGSVAPVAFLLPGNVLFLGAIASGALLLRRPVATRRDGGWIFLAATGLALAYTALYFPWPYTESYYAMPFLLGPALLFALAIQAMQDAGRRWPLVGLLVWAGTLGATAPGIAQATSIGIATQQVNGEITSWFARVARADRIVVARGNLPPQPWMGRGATLRRFALANRIAPALPPAEDLLCPDAAALVEPGLKRSVVVSYRPGCGSIPGAQYSVTRGYRYALVWWDGVTIVDDSLGADLLAGPEAMALTEAAHP